jgi:hypothetical protein
MSNKEWKWKVFVVVSCRNPKYNFIDKCDVQFFISW